jgi:TrmH family RNA methyltransferase
MAGGLIQPITSSDNAKYRLWKSLLTGKGIRSEGHCLVSGAKLLSELFPHANELRAKSPLECELIAAHGHRRFPELPCFELSKEMFHTLDEVGTGGSLLVVKTPEIPLWSKNETQGLHLLCPLGDPNNLGACLRSAEAFGADSVILLQESAQPFLPKSIKASSGSAFRIPLKKGPSIKELDFNLPIAALDLAGENLSKFKWPALAYLLIGEEGPGIPAGSKPRYRICIPTQGVESLNAGVATGIALYDFRAKK